MSRVDRLSALLSHFHMVVSQASPGAGNLLILGDRKSGEPRRIVFAVEGTEVECDEDEVALVELRAEWGGETNPLVRALSSNISLAVGGDNETAALVHLILAEASEQRCGVESVLSRLGEVIFVRVIRSRLLSRVTETGLLAGLADPRLSRAIVAMHENPGRLWRNDELAGIAGLSLSRFAEVFQDHIGMTPQTYLRRWRMTLAHQDIERGDRIKTVSRRYGYASSEALARAFQRHFGKPPLAARRAALEPVAG